MRVPRLNGSHSIFLKSVVLSVLALAAFGLTLPSTSYANTLYVCASTQCQTSVTCTSNTCYPSIAGAITAANTDDTISVLDTVHTEANIGVDRGLTIEGQGVSSTTVDGGGVGPVFMIASGITVTIQDMTVSGGVNSSNGGGIVNNGVLFISNAAVSGSRTSSSSVSSGGGIANYGLLTINNSTVSGNSASLYGGGILNSSGTLTIQNSTFSDNSAPGDGGALYNLSSLGTVTILNSTFSGNSAGTDGGAIDNASGTLEISFSTIANNSASAGGGIFGSATVDNSIVGDNTTGGDCSGTITGLGANLDTDGTCVSTNFTQVTPAALNLGALALNAPGTTETMALMSPSSAIDQIVQTSCTDAGGNSVTTDQRGVSRPQNTLCDIGAFEVQSGTATSAVSSQIAFGLTGNPNDTPTGANVTMGAFIHDDAMVTTTVDSIPYGSSVTFKVYPEASCTGTPLSSDTVLLNGGSLTESVESSGTTGVGALGPLAVGGVAYQAVFNSGDPISVPNATGACEMLNVQSPIGPVFYNLNGDSSTQYNCTLESFINGACPSGQQEATVGAGTTNNFLIDAQVTNLTDRSVQEYVEGTLAKGKDFSYTGVTTTCGNAIVKNNGDVLWNQDGAHSPNATGFTMDPGTSCELQVTVTATFSNIGQQEISGQWSASQTETSPITGQDVSVTSPVNGSLAVDVQ